MKVVTGFKKGNIPWNKGKKFSEASRLKMSQSMLGRKPHNKTNLDEPKLSALYKQGLGCNRLANIFGVHRAVIKRRILKLGLARTGVQTCSSPLFKKHMSKVRHETLHNNPSELKRIKELLKRIDVMAARLQGIKKSPTKIESMVYKTLEAKEISFEKQVVLGRRFSVDVYIPSHKAVIECDGDYWHNLPEVKARDKAKDAYLKDLGYKVFRFWEYEIKRDANKCVDYVLVNL